MPRLQVLNGKRQGEVFEIPPGVEMVVGHRQSANITIDDPWISWDHARLLYRPDSADCWIEDLGSTNGTYVNCVRVKREQLRHEDIIFLGKTHVIYLSPVLAEGDFFAPPPSTGNHTAVGVPSVLGTPMTPSPLAAPSGAVGPSFQVSSNAGPAFASSGGLPPLPGVDKDPFASTSAKTGPSPLWTPAPKPLNQDPFELSSEDPFATSSVDPFSSGPDYSGFADAGNGEAPRSSNPFAETRGDEQSGYSPMEGSSRSLSLSGLGEGDGVRANVPGPSSKEIARLIEGGGLGSSDLFGGDGLEPPPSGRERRTAKLPALSAESDLVAQAASAPSPFAMGSEVRPSEMRTQHINTDLVKELVTASGRTQRPSTQVDSTEPPRSSAPPPPPPPPAPAPAPQSYAPAVVGSPADTGGSPADTGRQAFERARVDDEVTRLRMALQAAKEQNPQAVQAAAAVLRDQELGRLAQRVAELEGELGEVRAEKEARESELNDVTDEMIEKEDLIDSLRDQLSRLGGAPPPAASPPTEQDWSSLEF